MEHLPFFLLLLLVGAQSFSTRVIDNTVEPVWDQVFEVTAVRTCMGNMSV